MARRVIDITITDEGRDKGKMFHITEMSSKAGEDWGFRALLALTKAGIEVPDGTTGMAGIAATSFRALGGLPYAEAKVLLDEMMDCVVFIPNPKKSMQVMRPIADDDIEEVLTRLRLRAEVFTLHTGFSIAELLSRSNSATPTSPLTSPGPETSRQTSQS